MEGKKKLKKLTLRKEEIVNLNDFEMNAAKGGTSPLTTSSEICSAIVSYISGKIVDTIIDISINTYNYYNKSKNVEVYVDGWVSRVNDEWGYCCASEVEVVC